MATLSSVLDIAKTALLASEKALSVTSHNIANASTPGYSRQKAVLEPQKGIMYGGMFFGMGVTVADVVRVYDSFQGIQLRDSKSDMSRYQSFQELVSKLESKLNDFGGSGLSESINALFSAFQSVSTDPSSYGERSNLLSTASILAQRFNNIDASIRSDFGNINTEIESRVQEINSLASSIAGLNKEIANVEIAGISANDLRDTRDAALESLAQLVDVTTIEGDGGQVEVSVAGGYSLVSGFKSYELGAQANIDNPNIINITSNGKVINDYISGGSLKGLLDGAAYFEDVHDKLNLLAASFTKEINIQHSAGFGLDGSTGNNFFSPPSIYAASSSSNTGGAVIAGNSITDFTQLTLNDYEVRFSSPADYIIVNTGTNSVVASGAYTSGNPITIDGISFTITDFPGAPATGDKFTLSVTKDAAMDMSVALTDPNKVAASSTAAGVPGDNTNALALSSLKTAVTVNGSTFSDFYNGIITDIGVTSAEASSNLKASARVTEELQSARDATSGVSLEEEAVNLVKLQRAYQAAAKLMTTADQMMESLLNIR